MSWTATAQPSSTCRGKSACGWSVTVVRYSRAVTDGEEIRRLEQVDLVTWAPGERDHFIRISPTFVNGRRVAAMRLAGDGDASSI